MALVVCTHHKHRLALPHIRHWRAGLAREDTSAQWCKAHGITSRAYTSDAKRSTEWPSHVECSKLMPATPFLQTITCTVKRPASE